MNLKNEELLGRRARGSWQTVKLDANLLRASSVQVRDVIQSPRTI